LPCGVTSSTNHSSLSHFTNEVCFVIHGRWSDPHCHNEMLQIEIYLHNVVRAIHHVLYHRLLTNNCALNHLYCVVTLPMHFGVY
jgi:hypothetical protein